MYPKEFIQYLIHFHGDRDYFECHEILEEYWKKTGEKDKHSVWVGFIQLAVSCYHHRRGNFNGAKKTLENALMIFNKEKQLLKALGLDQALLILLMKEKLAGIKQKQIYQSFNLPINAPLLEQQCISACSLLGFNWCSSSDMKNNQLVHRHILRNRIIQERFYSSNRKKGSE